MALNYTNSAAVPPEAADGGVPPSDTSDIAPVSAPAIAIQTPTAGVPQKSKDTYVKIKLSTDKATPDTWFKLIETKSDGVKIFENDKRKLVVMTHPERSALMVYSKNDMNSFFDSDSRKRNVGLLGRFYVSSTVPTTERPESRLYLSGKYHDAGLVDVTGNVKGDAVKLYGGIVGLEGSALMQSLKARADFDRERSEAYRARMQENKPSVPQAAPTPDSAPAQRPGDDLEFGM